jgi:hypothetical protein
MLSGPALAEPDPAWTGARSAPSSGPRSGRAAPVNASSAIEAAIETPTFDLTVFKLHFGRLTGKAYTKDEM